MGPPEFMPSPLTAGVPSNYSVRAFANGNAPNETLTADLQATLLGSDLDTFQATFPAPSGACMRATHPGPAGVPLLSAAPALAPNPLSLHPPSSARAPPLAADSKYFSAPVTFPTSGTYLSAFKYYFPAASAVNATEWSNLTVLGAPATAPFNTSRCGNQGPTQPSRCRLCKLIRPARSPAAKQHPCRQHPHAPTPPPLLAPPCRVDVPEVYTNAAPFSNSMPMLTLSSLQRPARQAAYHITLDGPTGRMCRPRKRAGLGIWVAG